MLLVLLLSGRGDRSLIAVQVIKMADHFHNMADLDKKGVTGNPQRSEKHKRRIREYKGLPR